MARLPTLVDRQALVELVPQLQWEVGANGGQPGQKVILYCLDGCLGGIDLMVVRLDELDLGVVGLYLCFNGTVAFVVKEMQCLGGGTSGRERSQV